MSSKLFFLQRPRARTRRRGWLWITFALALLKAVPVNGQTSAAHVHGHPKGMGHEHGPAVVGLPVDAVAPLPLYVGMGDHSMTRASGVDEAQAYFDQGLMLAYAFNHPEAAVSFAHAAELDPTCALCAWGEAMVLGPNINATMDPAANGRAFAASREALGRFDEGSTTLEQDLVRAIAGRYVEQPPVDRSALDLAYADAMAEAARRHPGSADVQALYADALMTTMPWDYWRADGSAKPTTVEVQRALEAALESDPRHPLANHLWIHLWEKNEPGKAVAAAERLEGLAPAAGHLVHMPAHVYIRVGRYADAVVANQRAIVADQAYLGQSGTEGLYRIGYVPHNVHFLWAAATLAGRSTTALDAADRLAAQIDETRLTEPGYDIILQDYWVTPILARVRFGRWEEILARPEPPEELLYPTAIDHYGRAVALARTGRLEKARRHVGELRRIAALPAMESFLVWEVNPASRILAVAARVAEAEVAAEAGDIERSISLLRAAVDAESRILYQEPEAWHHPVRQILGDVLLEAGRYAEAERAFREDLEKYPSNGWSLWGLAAALEKQGRGQEAEAARACFREAFRDADVELEGARF